MIGAAAFLLVRIFVITCIATIGLVVWQVRDAWAKTADDPSAAAWVGFLPYLLPVFFVYAMAFVAPVVCASDLLTYLKGRVK